MAGNASGKSREALLDEIFSRNYCNEEHMLAFERALAAPDDDNATVTDLQSEAPFIPGTAIPSHLHHDRVRKVSALSDFAPIHQRVKRYLTSTAIGTMLALLLRILGDIGGERATNHQRRS